ncbi:MAG: aldo/keto reductase [Acholeplasmataceae bacterium]|nr:aldo/keto reductase [Acholeplasmataceae bacterium]
MKNTTFAKTNKKSPRLGFGSWQLGNTEFWGYMSFDDGIKLVKEAAQQGITFFDTAPGYAAGMSETIIGEALSGQKDNIIINTKIGHMADGSIDYSVSSLEEQVYESLERLQLPMIDSVLLHNPDMDILTNETEHFEELQRLKEEGFIKSYGVSIDTYEEFEAVLENVNVDTIEILFNVFFQSCIPLFKKAKEKGITLIAKVPLDSGWLTGKYHKDSEFEGIRSRWDIETIEQRAFLVDKLKKITNDQCLTKYTMGFILSFPEIDVVIPGIKSKEQLAEHIKNLDYQLPDDIKAEFIKLYDKHIKDDPLVW